MKGQSLHRALRSALALLLCAALMFAAAGCGQNEPESGTAGDSPGSQPESEETGLSGRGYYVESERPMPEMEGYIWNLDIAEGALYLQGASGCWKSADDGQTWEAYTLESPLADQIEAEGFERSQLIFSGDGRIMLPMVRNVANDNSFYAVERYVIVETDGSERELEIRLPVEEFTAFPGEFDTAAPPPEGAGDYASALNDLLFLPDGSLVGKGMSDIVYHVDSETGEILHTIEPPEKFEFSQWISGIAATPNTLLLLSSVQGRMIDLETWTERKDSQTLDEFLLADGEIQEDGTVAYYDGEPRRYLKLFADGKEDAFYILDSNGIFRYIPGGSSIEEMMEASTTSLLLQNVRCQDFVKTPDNGFRALVTTSALGNGNEVPDYAIKSYDYDPDAVQEAAEELKVYSLYPTNGYMDQAIAVFQKNQRNVKVVVEEGLDPNAGAVNISDALRQLNTNIMADKGPDVFIMDAMPVDTYRSKGLLVDLADVVEQAAAENELLRNISDVYEKDGEICAVPTSFTMPIVVGPEEALNRITSLETLAQTVADLRAADQKIKSITGYRMPGGVMGATEGMVVPRWIQEDKTIDWDQVGDYYDQVKIICGADSNTQTEGVKGSGTEEDPYQMDGYIYDDMAIGQCVLEKESALELRNVRTILALPSLCMAMDKGLTYKVLEDGGTCGFMPTHIFGVNAKSGKIDLAKEFVKTMLGEEMQGYGLKQSTWNDGSGLDLPVNFGSVRQHFAGKEGETFLYDTFTGSGDDFQQIQLERRNPTLEELEAFMGEVQKLNAALPTQDTMINDALLPNCAFYVMGKLTKEESLKNAKEAVELYLAES